MTKPINKTQPVVLAFANGTDIKVHAAGCADLNKAATKREAHNGIHTQTFPIGTTERDVWIDFNEDFLAESGADGAYPLEFLPCCKPAGLIADADRSWDAQADDEWVEHSTDEVADMSEAFAADEEADEADEADEARAAELAHVVEHKDDKNKSVRNAYMASALALGVTSKQIADALGIEARAVREAVARHEAKALAA